MQEVGQQAGRDEPHAEAEVQGRVLVAIGAWVASPLQRRSSDQW